jgi:hypothetical protein
LREISNTPDLEAELDVELNTSKIVMPLFSSKQTPWTGRETGEQSRYALKLESINCFLLAGFVRITSQSDFLKSVFRLQGFDFPCMYTMKDSSYSLVPVLLTPL